MGRLERIAMINARIKNQGKVTLKEVVNFFDVNERTIKRDIEYMRNTLNAPLIYARNKGGYYYETDFVTLDNVEEKILVYYLVAHNLLYDERYFMPMLTDELLSVITDDLSSEYIELLPHITFSDSHIVYPDKSILHTFVQSLQQKKQIRIEISHPSEGVKGFFIEPLQLINLGSTWYILGFSHTHGDVKTFQLDTIIASEITDKEYQQTYSDADVNELVKKTVTHIPDMDQVEIIIRQYNVEKKLPIYWHQDQEIIQTASGANSYMELKLTSGNVEELIQKALAHSPEVEIVSPQNIRELWLHRLMQACDRFSDRKSSWLTKKLTGIFGEK